MPQPPGAGARRAVVARPRDCTLCRECLREPAWEPRVVLERVNTHFLFSVESTGAAPAATLVKEALRILAEKSRAVLDALDGRSEADADGGEAGAAGGASGGGGGGGFAERATGTFAGVPLLPPARAAIYDEAVMRSAEADDDESRAQARAEGAADIA